MRPLKATLPLLLALLAPALPATALAAAPAGTGAEADSALFTADGYRQTRYRSPTPDTVEHAVTVDTPAVQALIAADPTAVLVDSYRATWRHDRFIHDEGHRSIPGSLWLAYIGEHEVDAGWLDYLAQHLYQATGGDPDLPLVFFCRSDCWASWNAVRRAHGLGYRKLYWYRDGIDAWEQAGLPLVPATPAAPLTP